MLAHRLGVNAFFCALAEASRAHEGHCLATWRPEHWVRTRAAEIKPDGFARYLHPGGACEFYLEYDRGTEAFGALARKLEGYLRLAAGWTKEQGLVGFPNLLIIVPEGVREGEVGSALRHAIGRLHVRGSLATLFPLHVASEDQLTEFGVLGLVWKHLPTDGDRLSLVDLPTRSRRSVPGKALPRSVLHRRRCRPPSSDLPRVNDTPIPRPTAPTCPLTPRRADAPRTDGERLRRHRIGKASADTREAQGATPAGTTLARPGAGQPAPPEPRALRALARVLVDVALAMEHEDKEDEPWTR